MNIMNIVRLEEYKVNQGDTASDYLFYLDFDDVWVMLESDCKQLSLIDKEIISFRNFISVEYIASNVLLFFGEFCRPAEKLYCF